MTTPKLHGPLDLSKVPPVEPVFEAPKRLHLLKTPHGTRYWRYNGADSDDSRGENHVHSFSVPEFEVEEIGGRWEEGASLDEIYGEFLIDS